MILSQIYVIVNSLEGASSEITNEGVNWREFPVSAKFLRPKCCMRNWNPVKTVVICEKARVTTLVFREAPALDGM